MSNSVEILKVRVDEAIAAKEKAQHRFCRERLEKEDVIAQKRKIAEIRQEYLKRNCDAQDKILELK